MKAYSCGDFDTSVAIVDGVACPAAERPGNAPVVVRCRRINTSTGLSTPSSDLGGHMVVVVGIYLSDVKYVFVF